MPSAAWRNHRIDEAVRTSALAGDNAVESSCAGGTMKRKEGRILKIGGAVAAIILAITCPLLVKAYRQMREFNRAFDGYATAIQRGSFPSAYSMADAEFKRVTPYSEFEHIHRSFLRDYGELVAVTKGRSVVEGRMSPPQEVAVTNAILKYQHGTVRLKYSFRVSNGTWRLLGFERTQ